MGPFLGAPTLVVPHRDRSGTGRTWALGIWLWWEVERGWQQPAESSLQCPRSSPNHCSCFVHLQSLGGHSLIRELSRTQACLIWVLKQRAWPTLEAGLLWPRQGSWIMAQPTAEWSSQPLRKPDQRDLGSQSSATLKQSRGYCWQSWSPSEQSQWHQVTRELQEWVSLRQDHDQNGLLGLEDSPLCPSRRTDP